MKKYYFKCPKCGQDEVFYRVNDASDDGLGCLMFLLGMWIILLLWGSMKLGKVQCGGCGHIFRKPTMSSSGLARIAIFLFFILLLIALALMIYSIEPRLEQPGHYPQWLQHIASYINSHSYFIAVIVLPAVSISVVAIFISGLFSNFFYRRKLKKDFKYRVEAFSRSEVEDGKA